MISQSFLLLGGPKLHTLTTWPQNTIKIGVQQSIFWKTDMRHEGRFWTKKPKPKIPVIILGGLFLFQQQNTTICWNPYFYSALAT